MRVLKEQGDFQARAIAGTHTVLIALNCADERRQGLMGFAIRRQVVGASHDTGRWLRSLKVFKSIVAHPEVEREPHDSSRPKKFSTWEHPIQSFLWGDYTANPDTAYQYTVVPMYGSPGSLEPAPALDFEVRTEKEHDQGHGIWFNRGAIASQAFAEKFQNKAPSNVNDPSNRETAWLSRGLLEACLRFINATPAGDGLRVAAYEFTYKPVLDALTKALHRGVSVRIVYHDTTTSGGTIPGENEVAITAAALPGEFNNSQVLFPRTKPKIPHNKFIVRLQGNVSPVSVWTGSTNFTSSGFLGQTNVGHLVDDSETARQYLSYWELLKTDPVLEGARAGVMELTPNPSEVIAEKSTVRVFSPRPHSDLLNWYARRITDAEETVMFTAAFGIAEQLVPSLAEDKSQARFLLMEKPPTDAVKEKLKSNRGLVISYGAVLGEMYEFKNGAPVARRRIKEFDLEKWFLKEEHFRKANEGFVFFVHTKFLLIDPLSDDPLVCSGSANFSANSLLQNDENMLLIRGNTRVADIYLTEFDRIFRHFYFRDVANQIEASGGHAEAAFLDETDKWTKGYFAPGNYKCRRREMFFAPHTKSWVQNAATHRITPPKKMAPPPAPILNLPKAVITKPAPPKPAPVAPARTLVKTTTKVALKPSPAKKVAQPVKKAPPKSGSATKSAPAKKLVVKKPVAKKAALPAKKAVAAKKPLTKKVIKKPVPAKSAAPKKLVLKKAAPKKAVPAKSAAKKGTSKPAKKSRR